MTPKVSILIPVFNRENFIAQCIHSALDQTYTDFEVIIVDNCSTDDTWKICKHFQSIDSRVRIFRNEFNVGPVRNWLRCLEEAKGIYGKFLFSDDIIFNTFLSKTVPILENSDVGFVSVAAYIGTDIKNAEIHYSMADDVTIFNASKYLNILSLGNVEVPVSPGAAIFRISDVRRNLHSEIPTYNAHDFKKNGAGPDVLIFALAATCYKKIVMLAEPLVFFRAHEGSFTIENTNDSVVEGYRLALAWFFKNYSSTVNWANWNARIWLGNSKKYRRIENPISLLRKYSGNGNLYELIFLLAATIRIIKNRVAASIKVW